MAPITDKQVREAISAIIETDQPTAKIYNWNALSHNLAEWPGLFRVAGGTHGWVIKRIGGRSEWKNAVRDRKKWIYDIWGFYGFRAGKTADNSDEEFAEIVDSVYKALKLKPTLDLPEAQHELMQIAALTTIYCGEEVLHFCQGRLEVDVCC